MKNKLIVDGLTYTPAQIRNMSSSLLRQYEEINALKKKYTDHLELDADEDKAFEKKYQMRVSERDYWMGTYTQLCEDIRSLFVEYGYPIPKKNTYRDDPYLLLSDLRRILAELRANIITEYALRVNAERQVTK